MARRPSTAARRRAWRQEVARRLADRHSGVARRQDLIAEGLTHEDIRAEVDRGVWHRAGCHTLCVSGTEPQGEGLLWWALWESGPRAVLDGSSSLVASGLRHWQVPLTHVSVPRNATVRSLPGVRHHVLRDPGPAILVGLRRTKADVALIRAAQWERSDRAAATLVAMTVQQRIVSTSALMDRWDRTRRCARRQLLDAVIRDVCDGSHSINELDVVAACRAHGIPAPSRQSTRILDAGRVYLDLFWDDYGVHGEIQGAHHQWGLHGVDDAVRGNALAISQRDLVSLQIPVLGWRLDPTIFLDQIASALRRGGWAG
ncbi:hypothetical protein [uncultured Serinicoccus sp.]|uniref:hypothetical protein n=1 Tax=uncultured Serinicoccus sp. TaxID=735514 RepID=UPI002614CBDE|nr:hypothetical protein [uncultured Serinicoccus sp.]